jgi:hypothetical protein
MFYTGRFPFEIFLIMTSFFWIAGGSLAAFNVIWNEQELKEKKQ